MISRDIALIVGNGLSMDFLDHHNLLDLWDPRSPTQWERPAQLQRDDQSIPGRGISDIGPIFSREFLPAFYDFFQEQRRANPSISDFDVFRAIVHNTLEPRQSEILKAEACHFIAIAYSRCYQKVTREHHFGGWKWTEWLRGHYQRISAITSFNYDLTLEGALADTQCAFERASVTNYEQFPRYFRAPSITPRSVDASYIVKIFKPHGSVDFGVSLRDVSQYPRVPTRGFDDLDLEVIPIPELGCERAHIDIVLPSELNQMSELMWVENGRSDWSSAAKSAKKLVVVGLSYWDCDRDEIDELVAQVPSDALVYMVNPTPCMKWVAKLEARFGVHNVKICSGKVLHDI